MSSAALTPNSSNWNTPWRGVNAPPIVFGEQPRTSPVAFLLFQLVNATVFLRPAEIVPELLGLPIYEGLIFSCLFLSINTVRNELTPRQLYHNPITICVLGVWLACTLSHVTHGWLQGVVESTILFFKTALYFFLLVACVSVAFAVLMSI